MGEAMQQMQPDMAQAAQHPDAAEMRAGPRYTILIRAAKLVTRCGEYLGVIRDASENGISMRIFHPLPENQPIIIELQNGDRYGAELRWQDEERAGFRFAHPADIQRIIESPSDFMKRPVRLNLTAAAQLESGGRAEYATIQDISQQGAKVACHTSYAIDQCVKLRAEGMHDTLAKVRWRREGTCGLVFEQTLQFGELARIARALQARI
ncbi:MAG: PilZ domain-containing protein [Alteraurantiacibacter sp.]